MTFRSTCTPLLAIAALALSGFVALAQQQPAQPAPPPSPDASTPAAAPIERQPPSDPAMRRRIADMRQRMADQRMAMRPDMMQRNGPGNLGGAAMMRNRDGFPGGMGGAFHIAPAGMWWKNPTVVQRLTLTPEQTRKMDDIFLQSRLQLIDLKANVEKQQVLLEPMLSDNPPNTTKAMAQIDKVADARANLEKANAKMLLGIRGVLTPDQWTNLSTRGRGRDGFGPQAAPGPPDAPVTPRQPNDSRRRAPRPSPPPANSNAPVAPAPQP